MSTSEHHAALRQLIEEVMDIESVTLGLQERETLRAQGQLRQPAHEAFASLRPRFEALGHTPFMRRQDGQDVIVAVKEVFKPQASSPRRSIILFVLTVISVLSVGIVNDIDSFPITLDKIMDSLPTGLLFMTSLLGILGAHEMGHYLMAKRHSVNVSWPYFIPFPTLLGTMGAIIFMKEPSPNRRVQFDIGVAGPLAGLVVAIPVLIVGLLLSDVITQQEVLARLPPDAAYTQEGNSLLYLGMKFAVFGKLLPSASGEDVFIHAIAFAGWAGLFVTAFNLIPAGQLDGGHVVFGLFGERAQRARWPVIIVLALLGFLYPGWWLLAGLLFLLARRNAPVLDEITDLDPTRRWIAIGMLVIFVLIFMPIPIKFVTLSP